MSYVNQILSPGENIVYSIKFHWTFLGSRILEMLAGPFMYMVGNSILESNFPNGSENESVGRVLLMVLVFFAIIQTFRGSWRLLTGFIQVISTERVVTTKRLILKYGLIRRRTYEMNLSKLEEINLSQGIMDRIFGSGTLFIQGVGGDKSLVIRGVDDPIGVRRSLQEYSSPDMSRLKQPEQLYF